ncbi:hypothetical protein HOY82DRAFT_595094 [Tuber indicum]|nr:hypothetical protein HOY82DRAFT_595094 [Tuber indicum]
MSPLNYNWHSVPEGSTNFHRSHWGDGDFCSYNHGDGSSEKRSSIPPGIGNPHCALEPPPQFGSHGLGGSIDTSHPRPANLTCIYASPTEDGSLLNYPYLTRGTQPAQAMGYAIKETSIYNGLNRDYPQYPIRQELQLSSCFQSLGFYPNLDTGNPTSSPLPPHYQPAQLVRRRGSVIDYPSSGSHACHICGIRCKRQADLYRHLTTAREHCAPQGPVCPELGCKYTARFTRVDNFRAHYRRQHGKRGDEADGFIQEWRDRGSP